MPFPIGVAHTEECVSKNRKKLEIGENKQTKKEENKVIYMTQEINV